MDQIGVTDEEMNQVLDALAAVVEPVILRFYWRPQLKDPGDEMVLETAVNGGADRIATFNIKHLADLASRDAAGDDAIIRLNGRKP